MAAEAKRVTPGPLSGRLTRLLLAAALSAPVWAPWAVSTASGAPTQDRVLRPEASRGVERPQPRRYAYTRTIKRFGLDLGPQNERQRYEEERYEEVMKDLSDDKYFQEVMEVPEDEKGIAPAPPGTVDMPPSAARAPRGRNR